ncbi:transketolase [[Eubacterium] cellulosolvens]
MSHDPELIKQLERKAKLLRKYTIEMIRHAGKGWIGGSFSEAEILTALIFHHMRIDPEKPDWQDRDRLILSKAHCCEMHYAALGEAGYFPGKYFSSYGKFGGMLQAHSQRTVPGVDYSGGSLGTGLSFAVGEAIAAKLFSQKTSAGITVSRNRVYCIIGDGECDGGQIWEAALSAGHYKLNNITTIIDRNRQQSTGAVDSIMEIEPLSEKWRSFLWNVLEVDGHDLGQILDGLEAAEKISDKPSVIIANTVKGKGVPSFENKVHFSPLTEKMYSEAMTALT